MDKRKRKEWKIHAKQVLKKHYFLLVGACLFAAFLGGGFSTSMTFVKQSVIDESGEIEKSTPTSGLNAAEVVNRALYGTLSDGKKQSEELDKQIVDESKKGNSALGHSRGVLAGAVNSVASGSVFITVLSAISSVSRSRSVTILIFVILSALLMILLWFYVNNLLKAVIRRVFLESRLYEKVAISRFMFFVRVKRWTRAAWCMCVTFIYQSLWNITLIGGMIKHYSYVMVPYIIAENPDLKANEAITLSRKMMDGHKWECFKLDVSLFGWTLLGALTGGLSAIFFSDPYVIATYTEYYAHLRMLAIDKKVDGAQNLNDRYLFEKASEELLDAAYFDIFELQSKTSTPVDKRNGISEFFANVLGVVLVHNEREKKYQEEQERSMKISLYKDVMKGERYPSRLFTIPEKEKRLKAGSMQYLKRYSLMSVILLFFSFSFIGWLWEVSLHLVSDGAFVNRGVLHGPWLPIYGAGAVLILLALNLLRKNPVMEFAAAVVLSGIVEYGTSWYLQYEHGKKWWDYSGYFLNLNGRICAEGLLVFGLGGMAVVYVIAPLFDKMICKVKLQILLPVCLALICLFTVDQVYSKKHPNTGKGITDYQSSIIQESRDGGLCLQSIYHQSM